MVMNRSRLSESISVLMPTTPDSTCCGLTHAPAYRSYSTIGSKPSSSTRLRSSRGIVGQILFGVIQDGGGVIIVNGHIIRIPPRGPDFDLAQALVALDAAGKISGPAGRALTKSIYAAIGTIAKGAGQRVRG